MLFASHVDQRTYKQSSLHPLVTDYITPYSNLNLLNSMTLLIMALLNMPTSSLKILGHSCMIPQPIGFLFFMMNDLCLVPKGSEQSGSLTGHQLSS